MDEGWNVYERWMNGMKYVWNMDDFRSPFFNHSNFFLVFFRTSNQILVIGQQSRCVQVDQKIMAIKMATKIRSPFFNNLSSFKVF
jgi:hypothetical protein